MALLELKSVEKSFLGPDGVVQRVISIPAFQVASGSQVGLRGESGTGKTTFLHLIAGILKPDSGTIRLDAIELSGLSEPDRDQIRARQIGYIFQNFNLLQGYTSLENVLLGMSFGGKPDRARAKELLTRVGLSHRMNHLPSQLSVGQQQRVAVARALAKSPKIILADEPTGNLDVSNGRDVLALIRTIASEQGAALLFVSHEEKLLDDFQVVHDFREINQPNPTQSKALP